jgi:formylglycine-generating enzyme required for sulfatase activity
MWQFASSVAFVAVLMVMGFGNRAPGGALGAQPDDSRNVAAGQEQPSSRNSTGQERPQSIANSIGMKMVLIPAGEFMMGSGESAEETAAFFKKTYGDDTLKIRTIKASDGYVFTAPVGLFRPNTLGLYDMHGNACQWCADRCDETCYDKSPIDDPHGPPSGDLRVLRGGSWYAKPSNARSAHRSGDTPLSRYAYTGFRIAMTP